MTENPEIKSEKDRASFSQEVGAKATRKIRARKSRTGVWFGLGMMGLIGWSVVVPTLLGAALGMWLDNRYAGSYSWTLMMMVIGLVIGCLNAWHWVAKEDKEMREDQEDNNHE
jgi:ATP synthase protein I